jgi:hypothetical protein
MKPRRIATERLDTILKEATEVDDNAFVKANRSNTGEKLAPRDKYASENHWTLTLEDFQFFNKFLSIQFK